MSGPGFTLAAGYAALVVASFALTAATPSPGYINLKLIPFYLLTMPWPLLVERIENPDIPWTVVVTWIAWLAGIVVNTAAIYLIGSLMEPMWSQFMNWHKNRDH